MAVSTLKREFQTPELCVKKVMNIEGISVMHQRKPQDRKHVNEFPGTLGDGHKNGSTVRVV